MAAFNLGKLVRKKSFAPILSRLIDELGASVIIEDDSGGLLMATEGAQRITSYPVTVAGEIVGSVNGSEKVAAIASLLSYQAQIDSELRSLAAETLNKYTEITFLYETVERISSCLDTRELARLVIEQAMRVIRLDGMSVLLLNRESGLPELIAAHGHHTAAGVAIRRGEGIEGEVWATGRAELVNDIHSDPRYIAGTDPIASLMCAPLKNNDTVIGLVRLSSKAPVTYTAEDLKLFTTLASLAAAAIENAGLYEQLREAFFSTVYTLAETIEKRDPYTGNHTKRVMEYSLAIGKTLALGEEDMTRLQLAAVLHDVGKIGVRDSVLLKEGGLTDEEFAQIKKHPIFGEEIVGRIPQLSNIVPGVKHHHEKFDGRGYPDGLEGDAIDITARIIAVADSFDAMTSNRPYREGLSLDVAFEELRKYSGTQFDPQVVEAFFVSDVMGAFYTANSRRSAL